MSTIEDRGSRIKAVTQLAAIPSSLQQMCSSTRCIEQRKFAKWFATVASRDLAGRAVIVAHIALTSLEQGPERAGMAD